MLAAGSTEREIYDRLILDKDIRSKFTPDELEDHVLYMVRITREIDKTATIMRRTYDYNRMAKPN